MWSSMPVTSSGNPPKAGNKSQLNDDDDLTNDSFCLCGHYGKYGEEFGFHDYSYKDLDEDCDSDDFDSDDQL